MESKIKHFISMADKLRKARFAIICSSQKQYRYIVDEIDSFIGFTTKSINDKRFTYKTIEGNILELFFIVVNKESDNMRLLNLELTGAWALDGCTKYSESALWGRSNRFPHLKDGGCEVDGKYLGEVICGQ